MVVRPRALLVGDEISLLQTREMVLGTRFDVQISPRLPEAFSLVLKEPFDLVVVFPDIDSWREFGVFIARKTPKPTVVVVSPARGEVPAWADGVVSMTKGPFELLKVCTEFFGITMKSKSRGFSDGDYKKVVSISSGDRSK